MVIILTQKEKIQMFIFAINFLKIKSVAEVKWNGNNAHHLLILKQHSGLDDTGNFQQHQKIDYDLILTAAVFVLPMQCHFSYLNKLNCCKFLKSKYYLPDQQSVFLFSNAVEHEVLACGATLKTPSSLGSNYTSQHIQHTSFYFHYNFTSAQLLKAMLKM